MTGCNNLATTHGPETAITPKRYTTYQQGNACR